MARSEHVSITQIEEESIQQEERALEEESGDRDMG
jgi:hypothetical protein